MKQTSSSDLPAVSAGAFPPGEHYDASAMMPRHWRLETNDDDTWQQALQQAFHLDNETEEQQRFELLDSFGGLLRQKNRLLLRDNSGNYLLLGPDDMPLARHPAKADARFWWDFDDNPLRKPLKSMLGYWAVTVQANFTINRQRYVLRNPEQKIVARLEALRLQTADGDTPTYLQLRPLRGYLSEFSQAARWLEKGGAKPHHRADLQSLLVDQGLAPKIISGKLRYNIEAEQSAESAVRHMSLLMASHARQYEAGIIADIDTEFLHQFRVSLRKARSLISLLKGVFPVEVFEALKNQLATIAGPTGALRDLDVFLLERTRYAAMLPPGFETGFDTLFRAIETDRHRTQRKLARHLASKVHHNAYEQLLQMLGTEPQLASKAARQPIARLARQKTLRRYLKIIQLGSAIDDKTPDEQVHDLRIECKKLRYLLEFFSELFGSTQTKHLIAELKGLQDILGQFNDYTVQQSFLLHYGDHGKPSAALVKTVGGLAAVLHQHQLEARSHVQEAFARFARPDVSADFHALLDPEPAA